MSDILLTLWMIWLNPHNSIKYWQVTFWFCWWRNWGTEPSGNLLRIAERSSLSSPKSEGQPILHAVPNSQCPSVPELPDPFPPWHLLPIFLHLVVALVTRHTLLHVFPLNLICFWVIALIPGLLSTSSPIYWTNAFLFDEMFLILPFMSSISLIHGMDLAHPPWLLPSQWPYSLCCILRLPVTTRHGMEPVPTSCNVYIYVIVVISNKSIILIIWHYERSMAKPDVLFSIY